jgi:MFS transporter, MHS family, proline/betaine transporter
MALAQAEAPVAAGAALSEKGVTRLIVATSIGNALEWFDIAIYGYFAVYISKAFFPANDPTTSLLLTSAPSGCPS